MAEQPIDNKENDNRPKATATPFVGAITGNHGSEKVVHAI
jgi:hypothetical protein